MLIWQHKTDVHMRKRLLQSNIRVGNNSGRKICGKLQIDWRQVIRTKGAVVTDRAFFFTSCKKSSICNVANVEFLRGDTYFWIIYTCYIDVFVIK